MNNEQMYNMLRAGKFKGHTRITLENVKNGHRTIVEDDNMATNALPKIFESDYNGAMDFYNLMPLKNLLGGVFLFWNALTESADNMFPPAQSVNKLTAHAGQTSNTNADPTRGAPNSIATVEDKANGSIKFVWDWTLEEGNGQISAAALTHKDFGDAGLYPDGTMPLMIAYGSQISGVTYFSEQAYGHDFSEAKAVRYPIAIKDSGLGIAVWVSGTTFTEKSVRHPWVKPTLLEGASVSSGDNYTIISTRTATLSRTFTDGYTVIAQDASNYYVMERDSGTATKLYVNIISKTDMTVTAETINITESLARPALSGAMGFNGIVSNGYIYWQSGSDSKTFVRIDISTPANTDVLSSSLSGDVKLFASPIVMNNGIILGRNWLINGDYVYPVQERRSYGETWETWDETQSTYKNSPLYYTMPRPHYNGGSRYILTGGVLVPYLATCNNLQSAVTKSNSETMRVEYTVTFTEGA